jgi:flagellar biosynthesis protein FlhA
VLLTHLSEVIRNNLAQLLSYKDMRILFARLGPEYKRLIEDICRVSIRNLHLILEAIAEIVPRRSEQVTEHVRMRIAQQICGDFLDGD